MRLIILAAAILIAQPVSAQHRQPVESIKPLLLAAITQGKAHGLLQGPTAKLMRERFGATSPIEVDVVRLRPHVMPGCHRLSVKTTQAGVREGKGPAKEMVLAYEVNFCKNGQFPEEQLGKGG